jgi:uncharacterized protein
MQINVSQLLKSTIGVKREYAIDSTIDLLDDGNVTSIRGNIELIRTNRGILAKGTLHSEVTLDCSRCLCIYNCPLTINLEEEFFPVIDVVSGTSLPAPEEPDSFQIDEHHILDLRDAVRQNALLALPMKPLCREECAGICPECGSDLNRGLCQCANENIDPRWSKLVESLKTSNKHKEVE